MEVEESFHDSSPRGVNMISTNETNINSKQWLQSDNNVNSLIRDIHNPYKSIVVGSGSFGTVFCMKLPNGQNVAIKSIHLNFEPDPDPATKGKQVAKGQRAEYEILSSVTNPFIVEYYRLYFELDEESLFIFMEFCTGLSLNEETVKRLKPKEKAILFAQMCLGLSCLHNKNIFHRDIKPDNILLTKGNVIKIADFGRGKIVDIKTSTTNSIVGSSRYMAPEILRGHLAKEEKCTVSYTNKVDIWSLGCVLRFLVDGQHAFSSLEDIPKGEYKPLPDDPNVTDELRNLIKRMLQVEPNGRPDIDEILKDNYVAPYLRDIYTRFPQLNSVLEELSQVVEYVPEIDYQIDSENKWEKMVPVRTYTVNRVSVIDLSKYPQNDPNFSWVFPLWEKMVKSEFQENVELFLPPVRLPSNDDFGGFLVDIKLVHPFSKDSQKPSLRLCVSAKFSPYPRNPEEVPLPLKGVCNITIECSKNDSRVKPPTNVELKSRDDFTPWFIFQNFKWSTLDPEKPPTVYLSFRPSAD